MLTQGIEFAQFQFAREGRLQYRVGARRSTAQMAIRDGYELCPQRAKEGFNRTTNL